MLTKASINPVSIIIPTYDRSWGLKLAIESVLTQTYQDFEMVIVDDCSSDDTVEVVNSFGDSRIKFYRQEQNVGMVANWGIGLCKAEGEYVSFLMDDDLLRPNFLSNRVNYLTEDQAIVAVFSQYDIQDRSGSLIKVHNQELREKRQLKSADLLTSALSRQWFVGATLYRKKAVLAAWDKIVEDDLVLDFALNIQLSLAGASQGIYLPESDFIMTAHLGQNSQAKAAQVFHQTSVLLARLLEEKLDVQQRSLIKRELAQWHVVWGRKLAAEGKIRDAQSHFQKAVSIDPRLLWAWKQIGASYLSPSRLAQSSAAK